MKQEHGDNHMELAARCGKYVLTRCSLREQKAETREVARGGTAWPLADLLLPPKGDLK